jgi:hypothetical protein
MVEIQGLPQRLGSDQTKKVKTQGLQEGLGSDKTKIWFINPYDQINFDPSSTP